ncbi:type II toxin-antitoxin system prevent-host-death family antitoxin [Nitrospira sp. Nam74]
MPIKPISGLKNKIWEFSQVIHRSEEPVFITKNEDMVVMSMAQYDHLQSKLKLYEKLAQ